MEYKATLDNQISGPAKAAAGDLRALQGAALAASDAIKGIPSAAPGLPGAATGAGRGIPSAKPANDNAASKAAKDAAKLAEYSFQVKQRSLALAEKAETKASKDADAATRQRQRQALSDWRGLQRERAKAAKDAEPKTSTGAGGGLAGGAKLALGAAGALASAAAGASILQLALGYKGMARLQMITARASFDMRRLFAGINPTPALDALAKFEKNFSTTTSTGRVLQAVLTRTFDGFFKAVAAAEPYATAFLEGAIGAGLRLEVTWLKARIALFPLTDAIDKVTGKIDGIGIASTAGGGALVALGGWALWTAAPFIVLAGAITSVSAAITQASKLMDEWDQNSAGEIWKKIKGDQKNFWLGEGHSDEDYGITSGADYDTVSRRKALAAEHASSKVSAAPAAKSAGVETGKALGDGVVLGMAATEAAVAAAGGKLALAADKGVKAAAKIKSPSRLMRERGGQMGEGAALGIEDKAPRVQEAADRSLVPSASPGGGGRAGAAGAGITIAQIGPFIIEGSAGKTGDLEAMLRAKIPQIADEILRRIALELQGGLTA
jgi:hypothetical protein